MESERDYQDMSAGDEAPPDLHETGENLCPTCAGSGEVDGRTCSECGGTGYVSEGVGGG